VTIFNESRSVQVPIRLTPSQAAALDQLCEEKGVSRSAVIREALDLLVEVQELGKSKPQKRRQAKGRKSAGSKATPSASKAKVKATSKRSPSKSQGTKQRPH